jgi:transposase
MAALASYWVDIRLIFLLPFSPDLNPIEFAWKDVKKNLPMQEFETIMGKG